MPYSGSQVQRFDAHEVAETFDRAMAEMSRVLPEVSDSLCRTAAARCSTSTRTRSPEREPPGGLRPAVGHSDAAWREMFKSVRLGGCGNFAVPVETFAAC